MIELPDSIILMLLGFTGIFLCIIGYMIYGPKIIIQILICGGWFFMGVLSGFIDTWKEIREIHRSHIIVVI